MKVVKAYIETPDGTSYRYQSCDGLCVNGYSERRVEIRGDEGKVTLCAGCLEEALGLLGVRQ